MSKMKRWSDGVVYAEELREQATAWCRVRGLGDGQVPVNGWLTGLDDGKVRLMVFQFDEFGVLKFDFDRNQPVMRWATVDGPMPESNLIEDADGKTIEDWAQALADDMAN